jgi:hypothetical protein
LNWLLIELVPCRVGPVGFLMLVVRRQVSQRFRRL